MSAEEDTELRDLLVQTLENSGVLNKIKAELRAAVFLALEEQERVENKTPLVNESLKKFLNTRDGRLVAGLVTEFLQFFNLDFTLAVFQPETNTFTGLDGRDNLARELGIHEGEGSKGAPLLLEVIRRNRQKEKDQCLSEGDQTTCIPKELSAKHIADAKKKFEFYVKDKNGEISKEELRELFIDLFPHFHKNMLDRYVNDEFKAVDKDFNNVIDFDEFLGMYKRLFIQCRSVVAQDVTDIVQVPRKLPEGRQSALNTGSKATDISLGDINVASDDIKNRTNLSSGEPKQDLMPNRATSLPEVKKDGDIYLDEDEDSFFDDPLPEQMKTYGCPSQGDKSAYGLHYSNSKKNGSQKVISGKNSDTDEDAEDPFVETGDRQSPRERRTDLNSKPAGGLTSLSDAPPLTTNLGFLAGAPPLKEADIKGSDKTKELTNLKVMNEKICSLGLGTGDEEEYYDDDFISGSQRSDKTKSEVSIGEEIEEDISVQGEDFCTGNKLDDFTQDHTISHCSDVADYIEEVA
ncbi:FGFR1 oncogene partner isoform X2 [Heptranchias perlo]|uniref:FGFR1 oncogene partner isoform X2 n=1 Tax=Heptranchias perlo TaxID=212740 RepID=UPI003559A0A4